MAPAFVAAASTTTPIGFSEIKFWLTVAPPAASVKSIPACALLLDGVLFDGNAGGPGAVEEDAGVVTADRVARDRGARTRLVEEDPGGVIARPGRSRKRVAVAIDGIV